MTRLVILAGFGAAAVMLSLHHTKRGALRAMIRAQSRRWEARRSGRDSCLHTGLTMRDNDYREFRKDKAFMVRPVTVSP